MPDELWHEERQEMFRQLAEQTRQGKVHWGCTYHNPISLLDEDVIEDEPACVSHIFEAQTLINGIPYHLTLSESIDIPSGLGDISIDLTRDLQARYLMTGDALSRRVDVYEYCQPEELLERFADDPVTLLANAVVPQLAASDKVKAAFSWAAFYFEKGISQKTLRHPVTRLARKLFREQRVMDFHRIILDCDYRAQLLDEMKKQHA